MAHQLTARFANSHKLIASQLIVMSRASSSEHNAKLIKKYNPQGWKSWRDIPDSMIPTTATRDPDNKIYATRKYIDLRKQQIWYQIPDGKPVWLKDYPKDHIYYYGLIVSQMVMGLWIGYEMYQIVFRGKK